MSMDIYFTVATSTLQRVQIGQRLLVQSPFSNETNRTSPEEKLEFYVLKKLDWRWMDDLINAFNKNLLLILNTYKDKLFYFEALHQHALFRSTSSLTGPKVALTCPSSRLTAYTAAAAAVGSTTNMQYYCMKPLPLTLMDGCLSY